MRLLTWFKEVSGRCPDDRDSDKDDSIDKELKMKNLKLKAAAAAVLGLAMAAAGAQDHKREGVTPAELNYQAGSSLTGILSATP